jgi:hypothetical protein
LDKMATKTLADIYLNQGHLREAHEILAILAEQNPLDPEIRKKLDEVTRKLRGQSSGDGHGKERIPEKIQVLERWLTKIRERRKP